MFVLQVSNKAEKHNTQQKSNLVSRLVRWPPEAMISMDQLKDQELGSYLLHLN